MARGALVAGVTEGRDPVTKRRVLAAASSGGHWVQLCRLEPAFRNSEVRYLTTGQGVLAPGGEPAICVPEVSRSTPLRLPLVWTKILWALLRFRPHVVVTTGAAPGLIALQLARFLGSKTIWIDSIANVEEVSLSGKIARTYADLWVTQWPDLAANDDRLTYYGQVF